MAAYHEPCPGLGTDMATTAKGHTKQLGQWNDFCSEGRAHVKWLLWCSEEGEHISRGSDMKEIILLYLIYPSQSAKLLKIKVGE